MNIANRRWGVVRLLAVMVLVILAAAMQTERVEAQPAGLLIDHFKIYDMDPTLYIENEPLFLWDQFSSYEVNVDGPLRLGVPTDKNNEGIRDPINHLTWYVVNDAVDEPLRTVVYENQFGEGVLTTRQPHWLLVPALKNSSTGGDPTAVLDHFVCYDAAGDAVTYPVSLVNQFGVESNVLIQPRLFCNPARKEHHGVDYPIKNEVDHLVCYAFELQDPIGTPGVELVDQIQPTTGFPYQAAMLCVPSLKTGVTQIEEDYTWGKLKSIYR